MVMLIILFSCFFPLLIISLTNIVPHVACLKFPLAEVFFTVISEKKQGLGLAIIPKLAGRHAGIFPERLGKRVHVGKAQVVGDFLDALL